MLNINATQALSHEQIREKAPSIFTETQLETLSDKYSFIPTSVVLDDMEKLGWNCVDCKEIKSRKRIGYQKHVMVFRNPELVINGEDGDEVFPQVMISNSHDGTSTFVLRAGLYRCICENGLVIATSEFSNLKIRHMGYNFDELQQNIQTILENLPQTIEFMNKMTEVTLTQAEAEKFAQDAIQLRFPDIKITTNLGDLLIPTRPQDEGMDTWKIFNVLQEKLIHGDFLYTAEGGKQRKARPIKNFQQDILLNEKLWELAESYIN